MERLKGHRFPYDENTRLLLPEKLPDCQVRNEIYYEKIAHWILKIHKVVNSGTLVLFMLKRRTLEEIAKIVKTSKGTRVYVGFRQKRMC